DEKNFGVVNFIGENTVAVVHLNWVDGSDCLWPPATSKKLKSLTSEGALPQPDWKKFKFVSLGWFDTYEKARSKLPTAEITSDLCSDVELGRGKRKKARRLLSSESEPESGEPYQPPKPPTPPCFKQSKQQTRCDPVDICCSIFHMAILSSSDLLPHKIVSFSGSHCEGNMVLHVRARTDGPSSEQANDSRRVSREEPYPRSHGWTSRSSSQQAHTNKGLTFVCWMIRQSQQHQSEQLMLIIDMLRHANGPPNVPLGRHRFETLQDFLAFEEELAGCDQKRVQLMQHMQIIGGDNAKDKTVRIIRKMLCHEVGAAFTWYGTKKKGAFCNLQFCKVMCACLTANKAKEAESVTLKEIEASVMSWLRHAQERLQKDCNK
ncbi:unnamed protein product, partial [Ixodes hexagonus]